MAKSGGISGVSVGLATAGGVLVYAGIRGISPLAALRDIAGGAPLPVSEGQAESAPTAAGTALQALYSGSGAQNPVAGARGASGLVQAARKYIGVPYRWGGLSRAGLDCSGLVKLSFRDIGVSDCPRTSTTIMAWRKLTKVSTIAPGDILWWPGHVAIASSGTTMIEAPSAGKKVHERNIWRKPQLVLRYNGSTSKGLVSV